MKANTGKQQWVLTQLKRGRKLSPLEALEGCGTMRLAAIIHTLKLLGHDIVTIPASTGSCAKYATYKMVKKGKK